MKVFFILIILFSFINNHHSIAQTNELKLMYSPFPLSKIDSNIYGSGVQVGTNISSETKHLGAFIVDYNHYLNTRFKVGINCSYDYRKTDNHNSNSYVDNWPNIDPIINETNEHTAYHWFFIGPQFGCDYIRKDKFKLGSLVSVSLAFIKEETEGSVNMERTCTKAFFHIEALSFTWGKTNGLTGQLGYGHKGVLSIGYFFSW